MAAPPAAPSEPRQLRWWEPAANECSDEAVVEISLHGSNWWRQLWKFAGPGLMVAVTYVDPGNYATDLAAGSCFGYRLLWSLLYAHACGFVFHILVITLTLATGRTLSEEIGLEYPRFRLFFWFSAEMSSIAVDVSYVMGTAIALLILFDVPIFWGVVISICDTIVFLMLQAMGTRKMELCCAVLGFTVLSCCVAEISITGMSLQGIGEMFAGFIPFMNGVSIQAEPRTLTDLGSYLLVATSVVGASICPANYYLHSALVRTRRFVDASHSDSAERDSNLRKAVTFNAVETGIGIGFAFVINAIVMILAGKIFYNPEKPTTTDQLPMLQDMSDMLAQVIGRGSKYLFALALFAGGQGASVTGTLASQYILEGFLNWRIKAWLRRLVTRLLSVCPVLLILLFFGDRSTQIIDAAQVVVNFTVPFTLVPILKFTTSKAKMGCHQITGVRAAALWMMCSFVTLLNMVSAAQTLTEVFGWTKACLLFVPLSLAYAAIIAYLAFQPVRVRPEPTLGLAGRSFTGFLLKDIFGGLDDLNRGALV